jgi:hypothetical protein
MELAEARRWAANIRTFDKDEFLPASNAIILLDDRITELEAQRDELVEALIDTMKECEHPFFDDITLVEKVTGKLWEEIK